VHFLLTTDQRSEFCRQMAIRDLFRPTALPGGAISNVILSAARDLGTRRIRSFAALRMTGWLAFKLLPQVV
jgi:hypothetical protein